MNPSGSGQQGSSSPNVNFDWGQYATAHSTASVARNYLMARALAAPSPLNPDQHQAPPLDPSVVNENEVEVPMDVDVDANEAGARAKPKRPSGENLVVYEFDEKFKKNLAPLPKSETTNYSGDPDDPRTRGNVTPPERPKIVRGIRRRNKINGDGTEGQSSSGTGAQVPEVPEE